MNLVNGMDLVNEMGGNLSNICINISGDTRDAIGSISKALNRIASALEEKTPSISDNKQSTQCIHPYFDHPLFARCKTPDGREGCVYCGKVI